jgi:hypothetical protein
VALALSSCCSCSLLIDILNQSIPPSSSSSLPPLHTFSSLYFFTSSTAECRYLSHFVKNNVCNIVWLSSIFSLSLGLFIRIAVNALITASLYYHRAVTKKQKRKIIVIGGERKTLFCPLFNVNNVHTAFIYAE